MAITVEVSGMTCQHCVAHVKEELTALDGVLGVEVALNPAGVSAVTIDGDVTDEHIREAIDEAGSYTIESISR